MCVTRCILPHLDAILYTEDITCFIRKIVTSFLFRVKSHMKKIGIEKMLFVRIEIEPDYSLQTTTSH